MNILSFHFGHDGSVSILEGDEIVVHHQLDRFCGIKHQTFLTIKLFDKIKSLKIKFDKVIITSMGQTNINPVPYLLKKYLDINSSQIVKIFQNEHHIFHAECARHFFEYPDKALYFISDGDGAAKRLNNKKNKQIDGTEAIENESLYDENLNPIYKYYSADRPIKIVTEKYLISENISLGEAYQNLVSELGLDYNEEGKAMALSSYGKFNEDIAEQLKDNWSFKLDPNKDHTAKGSESLDFVKTFQIVFQQLFLNKIKKANREYDKLVLSGGCTQNVLNNSFLKEQLNKDILADPYNGDFGISLGSALHHTKIKVKPLKHICSGFNPELNLGQFQSKNVSSQEVAEILVNEPVAIFSGKSEQGQRGLGFRSLLGNPLDKSILDKINTIKKREWYRPFACTVLEERAFEFFDMRPNEASPYMMFTYKCKDERLKNVCSVDNLSRIQTLNTNFHPKYYDLIKSFERFTELPIVLNTSLNLPGRVLCEDMNDLYFMMKNSSLKYCYLSDQNKLLWKM